MALPLPLPPQYSMPLKRDPATDNWVGCVQLAPNRYCYQVR